jgi:hypothetical protein
MMVNAREVRGKMQGGFEGVWSNGEVEKQREVVGIVL